MRILMMCYEFPPIGGGGAGVVHGLSTQLVRMGHEVDVVTMHYRGLRKHEWVDGVQVFRVPCVRFSTSWCTMAEQATYLATMLPFVVKLARRRHYDINHTHFVLPDGLGAMMLRRIVGLPYVITSHGSDVPGYNPHRFRLAHRTLAPVWRSIAAEADRIFCPSELQQELVLRAQPSARTTVIPNGIYEDPTIVYGGEKQRRILVVTRMFERKGIQYFLRALQGMRLQHEVHIAGDGPYLPTLRALAEELGLNVRFWGWLDRASDELKNLYDSSEIYVFPSEAENFPLVLLEAMRAGAAIITTRGTGCAEVVGDTALLVEPCSPESIRTALTRLTGDRELCHRLGTAARTRMRDNFTWPGVAKRYLECYGTTPRLSPTGVAAVVDMA
jgi:glycosyltransferase involved in cell wall biosynthesis